MTNRHLETDYLVVGCGASGMAFTDALIADSDADVIMVDRRHAPGGHWLDAYPFVRLHQPSRYYGVNSLPLGSDTIDRDGLNQGFYEQAGPGEICAYYDRVMRHQLLPTGRVRWYPMCDYAGAQRFVSRLSGDEYTVTVRRAVVDATYLEAAVPATSAPPFDMEPDVRFVPVNALSVLDEPPAGYVIIGAGKTAIDACLWLLQQGVTPDAICWIKPREGWLNNRAFAQGGELVGGVLEGVSLQLEAAVQARTIDELFEGLEERQVLLRVDQQVTPTMYRLPTVSARELEQLRRIKNVVRLGRVRAIEEQDIMLDQGTIPTSPEHLHVHCAAAGLNPAPATPIFAENRITLQPVRAGLLPFNAALVGFVETTGRDNADKNRLCPPNRHPIVPADWIRGIVTGMNADYLWSKQLDIAAWLERARLNPLRGLRERGHDPVVQSAMKRYQDNIRPGLARLTQFMTG